MTASEIMNNVFNMEETSNSTNNNNDTSAIFIDDEDGNETLTENLSDGQQIALAALSILPAIMSIMGSALIIYMVQKETKWTPYRRLMFGLSLSDIIASFASLLNSFMLPVGSEPWAKGNDNTCAWMGLIWQLSYASVWYNGALSVYFLATVRFGVKPETFAFPYGCFCHFFAVMFSIVTSIYGYVIGIYGEYYGICWVSNDYPEGCVYEADITEEDIDDDTIFCSTITISWIFGGFPVIAVFPTLVINNLIIYWYVRRTTLRIVQTSSIGGFMSPPDTNSNASTTNHSRDIMFKTQLKRVQSVGYQSLMYVTAFLLSYTCDFIIGILTTYWTIYADDIFPLLAINSILYPMQGFFNAFVYLRPKYMRQRERNQTASMMQIFEATVFGEDQRSSSSGI